MKGRGGENIITREEVLFALCTPAKNLVLLVGREGYTVAVITTYNWHIVSMASYVLSQAPPEWREIEYKRATPTHKTV